MTVDLGIFFTRAPRRFRFFGMQRAGNHAVIANILRNAGDERSIFFNNAKLNTDPAATHRGVVLDGALVRGDQGALARAIQAPPRVLGVSYENAIPMTGVSGAREAAGFTEIIVRRSFLNWYASMARLERQVEDIKNRASLETDHKIIGLVRNYHKMIPAFSDPRFVVVHYDEWVRDVGARRRVLERLGICPRELSLGPVQPFGAGSSFDKMSKRAEAMTVTQRRDTLEENDRERAILDLIARDHAFLEALAPYDPMDAGWLSRR